MIEDSHPGLAAVSWRGDWDGSLLLLDQTRLPLEIVQLDCQELAQAREAIVQLRVRGAPAIGIAAAYATLLALRPFAAQQSVDSAVLRSIHTDLEHLGTSRPTAVNLFWALERMRLVIAAAAAATPTVASLGRWMLAEARKIHEEDRQMCHAIGRYGASLIEDGMGLLTHCNTGGLATAEYGTALSAFFTAQDQGKEFQVYVDETRPLLQGARLTAWELMQREVPCTLICDSMAAQVMREGKVQAVFVGADRITARGDTANKIGTYGLAVQAKHHGVPFYVAAPSSTFDLSLEWGSDIPIEQRQEGEITEAFGKRTAPRGVRVYNPAFDVTPAELITALITEKGIVRPVTQSHIRELLAGP
jgi:methylthioribose-1-phosphate isomerase